MPDLKVADAKPVKPRLPKEQRRLQLLETSRLIVREEGADELTLARLAERAGVSKPVVYDHFETRSDLLIALYRWIDTEVVETFRDAMSSNPRGFEETVDILASTYIACASDMDGEFHAVGAALAGSEQKAAVFAELLDNCVRMFVSVLNPHSLLPSPELERRCVALVGAGEALAGRIVRGTCPQADAVQTFAAMIRGIL